MTDETTARVAVGDEKRFMKMRLCSGTPDVTVKSVVPPMEKNPAFFAKPFKVDGICLKKFS